MCVLVGGGGGGEGEGRREGGYTHKNINMLMMCKLLSAHTQKACQPNTCSLLILHSHKLVPSLLLKFSQLKSREDQEMGLSTLVVASLLTGHFSEVEVLVPM